MTEKFRETLINPFMHGIVLQEGLSGYEVARYFELCNWTYPLHLRMNVVVSGLLMANSMDSDIARLWMQEALLEARRAEEAGEVPIGAILLLNEKVIGRGHNSSIRLHDPTAHAEIVALRQAAHNLSNYRLPGSILIVTIEPCIMCVGAMIQARVETLVYGAPDPKAGAVHSCFRLADGLKLNHEIKVESGALENECGIILKNFFSARRNSSNSGC